MEQAEEYVVNHHMGDVTKNYDYYLHPALAWPGDDPLITSVGGSELYLNAAGGHTSPGTSRRSADRSSGGSG